jgi:hypothetical protein
MTLLKQFLIEECTSSVRKLILDAIEVGNSRTGTRSEHFEFNRFEVTCDFEQGIVLIEDVLDPTEAGRQRVSLEEFSAVLSAADLR